jgi:hypothetical protein
MNREVRTFSARLPLMRSCKVCVHEQRARIEDALLRKTALAKIGEQYGISLHIIWRHSKHIGRSIITKGKTPLIDRVEALMDRLESISAKAQSAKEWHACVSAMKEVRCSLELLAKLTGQMPAAGQGVTVGVAVNVSTSHSASNLNDRDLDVQIAVDVSEATNGFDQATIERMKRLVQRPLECSPRRGQNGDIVLSDVISD